MGVLEKIRHFFGEEDTKETTVKVSELHGWFDQQMAGRVAEAQQFFQKSQENVQACKQEINVLLADLETAQLQSHTFSQRELSFMVGNREAFIKTTRMYLQKILFPLQIADVSGFVAQLNADTKQFAQTTQRQIQILGSFFGDHVKNVLIRVGEIERFIDTLLQELKQNDIFMIPPIHEDIDVFLSSLQEKELLRTKIEEQQRIQKKKQEEYERVCAHITAINNNTTVLLIRNQQRAAYDHLKKIETEVIQLLNPLSPLLRKYEKLTPNHQKLIKAYAEQPLVAFKEDQVMNLTDILANVNTAVRQGQLDLKDKKKEKMLSKLQHITLQSLNTLHTAYLQALHAVEQAQKLIQTNTLLQQRAHSSAQEYSLKQELERLQSEHTILEKRFLSFDHEQQKMCLQEQLRTLFKTQMTIQI